MYVWIYVHVHIYVLYLSFGHSDHWPPNHHMATRTHWPTGEDWSGVRLCVEPRMWVRFCELAPVIRKRGWISQAGSHPWTSGGKLCPKHWAKIMILCEYFHVSLSLNLMRRENIHSSNDHVITNIPKNPLMRKPVSYIPALNVANACHRDEEGTLSFLCVSYSDPKKNKKILSSKVFCTKTPKTIYSVLCYPGYQSLGRSRKSSHHPNRTSQLCTQ